MARAVGALVVASALFLAGFLVGRGSVQDAAEAGPDPDGVAVVPGGASSPVPRGTEFVVGPWTMAVESFDPEATQAVLAANQFNVEPPEGQGYVTVEVTVTRRAEGPGVVRGSLSPALVTPAGATYPLGTECGVIAEPLDPQRLLATGESTSGQWCWLLPRIELDKVALRVSGTGGGAVWFDLR